MPPILLRFFVSFFLFFSFWFLSSRFRFVFLFFCFVVFFLFFGFFCFFVSCMFTVELGPLFDFATAGGVHAPARHREIVKRFEINALRWVLCSPKTVYDPIRVLRALESHEPESDRGTEKKGPTSEKP
jgi:hypothetical protein